MIAGDECPVPALARAAIAALVADRFEALRLGFGSTDPLVAEQRAIAVLAVGSADPEGPTSRRIVHTMRDDQSLRVKAFKPGHLA